MSFGVMEFKVGLLEVVSVFYLIPVTLIRHDWLNETDIKIQFEVNTFSIELLSLTGGLYGLIRLVRNILTFGAGWLDVLQSLAK